MSQSVETTVASGASVVTASGQFTQNAVTASQATEAERSLVVSSFEESGHQQTTQRTLHNANRCYAVTYFVRRVLEAYEPSTHVTAVEWRLDGSSWRDIRDLDAAPDELVAALKRLGEALPLVGEHASGGRRITIPTDGAVYEPELAHCSSCEPLVAARQEIDVEMARLQARRACVETELLELELVRRRGLAATDSAEPLELAPLLAGSIAHIGAAPTPPLSSRCSSRSPRPITARACGTTHRGSCAPALWTPRHALRSREPFG